MRLGIIAITLACFCGWIAPVPAAAQDPAALEDLLSDIEAQPSVENALPADDLAEAAPSEPVPEPAPFDQYESAVVEEPAPVAEDPWAAEPPMEESVAVEEPLPSGAGASAEEPVAVEEALPVEDVMAVDEALPVEEPVSMEEPVAVEEPAPADGLAGGEAPPASLWDEPQADLPAEAPAPAAVEEALPAAEEPVDIFSEAEEPVIAPIWEEAAPAEAAPAAPAAVWAGEEVIPAEEAAEQVAEEVAEEAEEAEAAPDEKPKKKLTAKEARALAAQEEVKRQAMQVEGERKLEAGYEALRVNDFQASAKAFEDTLKSLPDRPQNAPLRERARWGQAESNYRLALETLRRQGPLKQAREYTETALRIVPEHRPAALLMRKIEKEEELAALPKPPAERPEVIEKQKTIGELYNEGVQFFDLEDYNRAEKLFEQVLLQDEYHTDAMRYLRRVDERRFKARTREREAAIAGMMQEVRGAWNPPIRDEIEMPDRMLGRDTVVDKTASQRLQEKLAKIIIPSLEFRQANIHDVVKYLVDASIVGDPEGVGVNIILNLGVPGGESVPAAPAPAPAAPAAEPFADEFDSFFAEPAAAPSSAPVPGVRTITLNLRRVSLIDAIKYITEVANLKFRIEESVVIITPAGVVSGRVVTRLYPVQPSILDVIVEKEESAPDRGTGDFIEMGGGRPTMKRGDVKDFFERAGVPFPVGTSITYNPTISQLIVANTAENLDTFERILTQLNVIPTQVEIEARFVEVNQSDLEELGLQWILTDNYEFLQRQGSSPLAGAERVQVNADPNGFTKGLRFFSLDKTTAAIAPASAVSRRADQVNMGGIMSVASVLTNPELTVILQALSQKGNADLLSAPRITTRSGVNAQIQVVKEIIYPTEFEVTQPTVQSQGDLVTPPTVTPGAFQTREVGVILNVTPTVGPDGYTIDLTLVPEVAELVDWIQYGSEITLEVGTAEARQERTYRFNMPQPVFTSRNVTTSIVIWDNQTVVMGGLIREELVSVKDKIPFLGDIPIIGRLFRTEGQSSRKTNLIIFVTARLVDPAGKPLHKAEARAMPGGAVQGGEITGNP